MGSLAKVPNLEEEINLVEVKKLNFCTEKKFLVRVPSALSPFYGIRTGNLLEKISYR